MKNTAIEITNFSSRYGQQDVLQNISLTFSSKAITAIIGPSGCGKTTLLRSINRTAELEPGYSCTGNIHLFETSIFALDAYTVRRQAGMVFQTPVALPLNIRENILFAPRYYGLRRRALQDQLVESCLRKVGLWEEVKDRLQRPASHLSGGQKQRLAIARVLAVEPRVLLLDEPCSSLDPASTQQVEDTLRGLASELCVIIVTHNLAQARRIANEIVFILNGQLIEAGAAENIFSSPQQARTRDFVSGLFG
ncbi:phosphate ABC transporter ATP-binding protein [Syntrophomonas palmitatica]|uniref:phosphate ABC transporter ATP-binding protein n=1 Tax=Syntrophomonas palmitatica TaxID=402877 RepID=UPI0006D1F58D|nr:phosphate ABC transporter ATP-binding protein [Syntrophomonas palmitatica]